MDPSILARPRMISGEALSRMAKPKVIKKVTSRTTKPVTGSWKMHIPQPILPEDLLRSEGAYQGHYHGLELSTRGIWFLGLIPSTPIPARLKQSHLSPLEPDPTDG
jgi:hypothetical protein